MAPDDDAVAMYDLAMDALGRAGYEQYEISNVARPGRQARHNVKYWKDGEWFGFGPGAHSTWRGERWKNVAGTADYVGRVEAGVPIVIERRVMTMEERWQEALMTGLRLTEGMSVSDLLQRYGLDIRARYGHHLQPCFEAGLLVEDEGWLRLTRRGMMLANEVLAVFF